MVIMYAQICRRHLTQSLLTLFNTFKFLTCVLSVWISSEKENDIQLITDPNGNSWFCSPENLDVSLYFVSGNIEIQGKTKLTVFPGTSN